MRRREELEARLNVFLEKCDCATMNITKLKEQAEGFLDQLNCDASELKDKFLTCMKQLEEYNYLITDFNLALDSLDCDIKSSTHAPVPDVNRTSLQTPLLPIPAANLVSEPIPSTSKAPPPPRKPIKKRVPKDYQLLIDFSSVGSCSSESVLESKCGREVESILTNGAQKLTMEDSPPSRATREEIKLPGQKILQVDCVYPATITHVCGLSFYIITEDFQGAHDLMIAMTEYYRQTTVELSLDDVMSLNYCALYYEESDCYYRGLFIRLTEEDMSMVEVFLVDTGETLIAPTDNIQPLDKRFCTKPPFARYCHFAGLDLLCDSSKEDDLYLEEYISKVCQVRIDDNSSESLGVYVILQSGEVLNDLLVQRGLARRSQSTETSMETSPPARYPRDRIASPHVRGQPERNASLYVRGQPEPIASPHVRGQSELVASPHVRGQPELIASPHVRGQSELIASPHVRGQPELIASPYVRGQPELIASPYVRGQPERNASPYVRGQPERNESPHVRGPPERNGLPPVRVPPEVRNSPPVRCLPDRNESSHVGVPPEVRNSPPVRGLPERNKSPHVRVLSEVRNSPSLRGLPERNESPRVRGQPERNESPLVRGPPEQRNSPPVRGLPELDAANLDITDCPEYEDPLEAVTGYHNRDEMDICKYYKGGPEKTCFKGWRCKKRHELMHPEGWTLDRVPVVAKCPSMSLPKPGTFHTLYVTHITHPIHFYAHLVDKTPKKRTVPEYGVVLPPTTLNELILDMNSLAARMAYKPLKLPPAMGQLVAAMYPLDEQWYRARVVNASRNDQSVEVKVMYIDYGNLVWVKEDLLRELEPRFWPLPAQAVRCKLAGVAPKISDPSWAAAREALNQMIYERELQARIIARGFDDITVELVDERGFSIAEELAAKEYVDLEEYEVESDTDIKHRVVVP